MKEERNLSVLKAKLFEFAISSDIFEKYRKMDSSLNEIVIQASTMKNAWDFHPDISIGISPASDTSNRKAVFQRRLRTMPDDPANAELREAIVSLINFCESDPSANICTVAFNSSEHNYVFFCGIEGEKVFLISGMVGRTVPKELFKYA